jgi:hypothetical protein
MVLNTHCYIFQRLGGGVIDNSASAPHFLHNVSPLLRQWLSGGKHLDAFFYFAGAFDPRGAVSRERESAAGGQAGPLGRC